MISTSLLLQVKKTCSEISSRNLKVHLYIQMGGEEIYFGFASNLSKRKMTERGTKFLSREGAVLRGYRLEFSIWKDDGFGYANIVPDEDSIVYGALYCCEKGSMAMLDAFEAGRLRRIVVKVEKNTGEVVEAFAFQAYQEFVREGLKPSEVYVNEMLEGEDIIPKEYAEYLKNLKGEKWRAINGVEHYMKYWCKSLLIEGTGYESR